MNIITLIGRSLALWWKDWIGILFLNIAWLMCQILLIPGPPATAALYIICSRIAADEVWDTVDVWRAFRQHLWPAWKWGLVNGIVAVAIIGNFYGYRELSGGWFISLRLIWGGTAITWAMLNLFFWPFWLKQTDKSFRTTYLNCWRFFLMQGPQVVVILLLAAVVVYGSLAIVVPLTVGAIVWIMILTTITVEEALDHAVPEQAIESLN